MGPKMAPVLGMLLLMLPLSAMGARWRARRRAPWDGVIGGLAEQAQPPATPCSCECCQVGRRTPAEMASGATQLKCIMKGDVPATDDNPGGKDCPDSCALGLRAKVMTNIESDTVLYSQYCFLECRPFDIELGSHCVGITVMEAKVAATKDGSGQDIHVVPVVQQPPTIPPPLPPPLSDELLGGDEGASMKAPSAPIPPAVPAPSPAEEKLNEGQEALDAADALQGKLDEHASKAKEAGDKAEGNAIAAKGELKEGWPEALLAAWRRSRRGFLPGPHLIA